MTAVPPIAENPYPGLRPFDAQEDYLFFGRDEVIDQLLKRLRETRFLAVIGSSGCGKSSVVRAGMVPSLYSGYMLQAGSSWRVAICRPGSDPMANLLAALCQPEILAGVENPSATYQLLLETTLRRSNLGLVECFRQARLPARDNLLIVVDQFEELFRFRRGADSGRAREEGIAFVKRLLAAAGQNEFPIYIALTMRSDFIGDCTTIPGLPDAINAGQFLVPRMDRLELRAAITGPAAVAGATISPRLVVRLLNEIGDDPDQLPVLQHALMRTWDCWADSGNTRTAIDLEHYEKIGTLQHALSEHAEEAYAELAPHCGQHIVEQIFRALIDVGTDGRITRNPTTIADLAAIAKTSEEQVREVVECFRQPGRCFLVPPAGVALTADITVDLAHESLARVWRRLRRWAAQEGESVLALRRLIDATEHYHSGKAGLWRDPELAFGLQWRDQQQPTPAWAAQYATGLERALTFLEASRSERDREFAERRRRRRNRLLLAWGTSMVLLVFAVYALQQQREAEHARNQAEMNLQVAKKSVDEMLTAVGKDWLADMPQMEAVRNDLLVKAQQFYQEFAEQQPANLELAMESAVARLRIADIDHMRNLMDAATAAYRAGIGELLELENRHPFTAQESLELVRAFDNLGTHLTDIDSTAAEDALRKSISRGAVLVVENSDQAEFQYELARSHNNLGILLARYGDRRADAESSYREAIALFGGIENDAGKFVTRFMLAKTWNSLGNLQQAQREWEQAGNSYQTAIDLFQWLVKEFPYKREYRENLARTYNNLANSNLNQQQFSAALAANDAALTMFTELASPIHSLRSELANAYNTRGGILEQITLATPGATSDGYDNAVAAYGQAKNLLSSIEVETRDPAVLPPINQRSGNALANIARLRLRVKDYAAAATLLKQAEAYHLRAVHSAASSTQYLRNLSETYWLLEQTQMSAGEYRDAAATALRHGENVPEMKAHFRAARVLAFAAEAAGSQPDQQQLAESFAQQAVMQLSSAVAQGMPLEQLAAQASAGGVLENLRNREDFKKLLQPEPELY